MNGGLTYVDMDRRKEAEQRCEIALRLIESQMQKPNPPIMATVLTALRAILGA